MLKSSLAPSMILSRGKWQRRSNTRLQWCKLCEKDGWEERKLSNQTNVLQNHLQNFTSLLSHFKTLLHTLETSRNSFKS